MVTPIIMESEIEVVREKIDRLVSEQAKRIHFDFGDGLFSELLTIVPADLQQFDLNEFEMDFHLLVDDPTEWIEECVALNPARLIAQIEHMGSQVAYLRSVQDYGIKGGLALKIDTPIESIEETAMNECDTILLLAIPPGTTGSPFDVRVLEKIKSLRKSYKGNILIDGGINPQTYQEIIEAGATEAGANSAYWSGKI